MEVTSPKCQAQGFPPARSRAAKSLLGEGPFPARHRGIGMWEAERHHPTGMPVVQTPQGGQVSGSRMWQVEEVA